MSIDKLRELLLNGDDKVRDFVSKYFNGDIDKFMSFVESKEIIGDDDIAEYFLEEYPMNYLLRKYNKNPQKTIDFVIDNYLTDVDKEGDQYWMSLNSRTDLSNFFREGYRDGGSREASKGILDEDWPDWWRFDSDIQSLENLLDDLSDKNLNLVKERTFEELEGQEVMLPDGETDIITKDMIMDMDNDDLSKLIENEAIDLYTSLGSLVRNAEESAFYDEIYDLTMSELKGLFGMDNFSRETPREIAYWDRKTGEKKMKTVYDYSVNVSNIIEKAIVDTLEQHLGYDRNELEYQGGLENVLSELFNTDWDYLDFHVPEWADYERVRNNVNDMFVDYI
jgi:hypothetical protein